MWVVESEQAIGAKNAAGFGVRWVLLLVWGVEVMCSVKLAIVVARLIVGC